QTVVPVRRESSLAVLGSEQGLLGRWGQSRGRGVNGRRGLRSTASSSAGFGRRVRSAQPVAVDEGIDALGEPATVLLRGIGRGGVHPAIAGQELWVFVFEPGEEPLSCSRPQMQRTVDDSGGP